MSKPDPCKPRRVALAAPVIPEAPTPDGTITGRFRSPGDWTLEDLDQSVWTRLEKGQSALIPARSGIRIMTDVKSGYLAESHEIYAIQHCTLKGPAIYRSAPFMTRRRILANSLLIYISALVIFSALGASAGYYHHGAEGLWDGEGNLFGLPEFLLASLLITSAFGIVIGPIWLCQHLQSHLSKRVHAPDEDLDRLGAIMTTAKPKGDHS
jgi:hypothetical protein